VRSCTGRNASAARRRERVRRAPEVLDRQLEEELLVGEPGPGPLSEGVVVVAGLDGLVEDRRIGGEAGDRVVVDVVLYLAGVEQASGDVVEPEALPAFVQDLGGLQRPLLAGVWRCRSRRSCLVGRQGQVRVAGVRWHHRHPPS
jgi:hypothetical protein